MKPPECFKIPNKKIYEISCFEYWLKEQGYPVQGVQRDGDGILIYADHGAQNPSALVSAYVNPNYYKMTCNGVKDSNDSGLCTPDYSIFHFKIGSTAILHIRKTNGADESLMPDNDTLDLHWHLPNCGQPKTVTLVNGEAEVVIHNLKRMWGFVEAVPTGSSDIMQKCPQIYRGGIIMCVCE